jgi:hypothetical protein
MSEPELLSLPAPNEWQDRGELSPYGHPIRAKIIEDEGEEYHGRDELSQSNFKLFIDQPELFERVVILGVEELKFSPATVESMDFGNRAEYVLMNNKLPGEPITIPREILQKRKRSSKWFDSNNLVYDPENEGHHIYAKAGKDFEDFKEAHPGGWLIHPDEYETEVEPLLRVRDQVRAHEKARSLIFGPTRKHVAIVFVCPFTGRMCRCQLDVLSLWGFIVDIKTARDVTPRGFVSAILTQGYHIQEAWYRYAVYSLIGRWLPFFFVAIRNKPPYNVETFDIDEEFQSIAEVEWKENMLAIDRSFEERSFRTLTHNTVVTLSPPAYAKPRTEMTRGFRRVTNF